MTTRRTLLGGSAALAATIALGAEFAAAQESSPVAATPIAIPAIEDLPLRQPGKLTIHADQPLYPPWFIDNDPTNGQGFESAVAYAIARAMGFTDDQVEWGYTSFNASYSPGPKDFDFYITEVSITEEREQVCLSLQEAMAQTDADGWRGFMDGFFTSLSRRKTGVILVAAKNPNTTLTPGEARSVPLAFRLPSDMQPGRRYTAELPAWSSSLFAEIDVLGADRATADTEEFKG